MLRLRMPSNLNSIYDHNYSRYAFTEMNQQENQEAGAFNDEEPSKMFTFEEN